MKKRFSKILEYLNHGIYERQEEISILLLSSLSGQNAFLLGPPGTAKSLLSRRLSSIFNSGRYYEYLMHRFSSPEDIFGPISISELKKDRYTRKTDGFLPSSDFVFLDEIWKSSPAILNTLLTIMNERKFRNGDVTENIPLKFLISASNEIPQSNQGLEALYDRFITRLYIEPLREKHNFDSLLQSKPTSELIAIPKELLITDNEWKNWQEKITSIRLSTETLNIIHEIRKKLILEKNDENERYISDRRWQKSTMLLKASAFFCNREETNLIDSMLLKHCLWASIDDKKLIEGIIDESIKTCSTDLGMDMFDLEMEIENLEVLVNNDIFHNQDEYKGTVFNKGKEYVDCIIKINTITDGERKKEDLDMLMPVSEIKSGSEFHPISQNDEEISWIKCIVNKKDLCTIFIDENRNKVNRSWVIATKFQINKKFNKGDRVESISLDKKESLQYEINGLLNKIEGMVDKIEYRFQDPLGEIKHLFVSDSSIEVAMNGVYNQKIKLKSFCKECERLLKVVG